MYDRTARGEAVVEDPGREGGTDEVRVEIGAEVAGEGGEIGLAVSIERVVMANEPTTPKSMSYLTDGASTYPVQDIAAAWERERPGTPVTSIGIVTHS
ncbi:hypothetical protein GCM10009680_82470 [Streptomyces yatensis]|uniref:Uncharacterized protein n=1 Tax=Streptomyces yatensis TaxID=155177 RepID=A0ABN2JIY2_9ACTN